MSHLEAGALATSVAETLRAVQWDFAQSESSPLHALHPYPAKFISSIPGTLLDVLHPDKGTVVLDPFCGSGTTLVEAQRRGFPSIGLDLNPIAVLMTRVKTSPLPAGVKKGLSLVVDRALNDPNPEVPPIPRLDHWFKPPIQRALAAIASAIGVADAAHQDILRLALSSIVVRVSKQDSDTRYAAIEKKVSRDDVFKLFVRAADLPCFFGPRLA